MPPTIQGSESVHEKGLEQTLFDRLCLMVCTANHILRNGLRSRSTGVTKSSDLDVRGSVFQPGFELSGYHFGTFLCKLCLHSAQAFGDIKNVKEERNEEQ